MAGDGTRAAMFEPGNRRLAFEPHGLTPEGMGALITRSVAEEKAIRYDFIDGIGQAFRLRVEGRFLDGSQVWFVERTLSLAGGIFDADEMFIPEGQRSFGRGRRLMLDLVRLAALLDVERIAVQARKVGRYAWLRMGFVPDEGSWRDMRGTIVRELFRVDDEVGPERVAALVRQVATGRPEVAGVLAALTVPLPSTALRADGRPVMVPLGKALFIDAVGDWSGAVDVQGEGGIALAEAYAGSHADDR